MTKAQIYFSNALEQLASVLKENLFTIDAGPFDKRLIAVPHLGLKSYLMQTLAKDPDLQIAAGLQIVNLPQAFSKISRKGLPSTLELSLFLQYHLLPLIETEAELRSYFATPSGERRIGPFCDALALYFQRYAIYGKKGLSSWQEKLWKLMKQKWTFPTDPLPIYSKWQVHLFGFSFIPKSYFQFFQKTGAAMYLFSPCEIYWGDFYTDKERKTLGKELRDAQADLFEQSFEDQNPLLANWGKVGRKMLDMVEEGNLCTEEHYVDPPGDSALHNVQRDCLGGAFERRLADETISFFSAATPLREVEILKNRLLKLFSEEKISPRDVQVFAPDICIYAPYIHAVFGDIPYSISDLESKEVDDVARAFAKLIELPKNRFALEDVLQLFSARPFQEKWDLNITQARKWLERANIRWGFSKKERRAFYLRDVEERHLVANPAEGTWESGLKRLVLGLGQIEGDGEPLCAIEVTEMEQFDRLYTLIHSLSDDLSPFYNGTKWTIPTWLRYFGTLLESYFAIDPTHDLYQQLHQLAASSDSLDQEEVSFCAVERVLEQLLSKKGKMHHPPHLQAISFGSLSEGSIQPGKVICLLGMQEDHFPGREENGSLYAGEIDYRPKKGDQDRYLTLQSLHCARSFFIASYLRDETGKWGASQIVQDLLQYLEGAEIVHHPAQPFDPNYFNEKKDLISYSQEHFAIAKAKFESSTQAPLIKGFYEPIAVCPQAAVDRVIDIQKLFKFARHPLRYFLHEKLGVYPEYNSEDQAEYLLSPLTKYQLVQEALKSPLEEVLQKAERRGDLPLNLLSKLAKDQIRQEIEQWHEAMAVYGIAQDELPTKKIELQVGRVQLVGKIDFLTSKGLLVRGKNCFEDRIRYWPQALLMEKLGLPLIFIKDQESITGSGSLEKYIEYFLAAEENPSPLLPDFAKSLLQGTGAELKKELNAVEDEAWNWLLLRDPLPHGEMIHSNWSGYLKDVFGGVDATV